MVNPECYRTLMAKKDNIHFQLRKRFKILRLSIPQRCLSAVDRDALLLPKETSFFSGSDFFRGFKLPEIWNAHRCDCVVFKVRSSLKRKRRSEVLLARKYTIPLRLSSKALLLSTFRLHHSPPVLASFWVKTIPVWKRCAPVASCPWLHADSNNVLFAWLQIAGSGGNDWAGATGLSQVDRIHYPHLLFTVIGLTPGMDVGVGKNILSLKCSYFPASPLIQVLVTKVVEDF